jgi:ribose 5-phosphate isomerase B
MKIYIGADHRGFKLKEKIAKWLFEWNYKFEDLGNEILDPNDDYPQFANDVASLTAADRFALGILVCGSGVGMEVAANKFDGVRAGIGKNPEQVRAGRNDDDMNILVIAADFTGEDETREMVKNFLETKFAGKPRFEKRLEEIEKVEANN